MKLTTVSGTAQTLDRLSQPQDGPLASELSWKVLGTAASISFAAPRS